MQKNDRQSWETNRHMKRRARPGLFWCWGCDGYLVGEGQKCPSCGQRPRQKIDKNDTMP